MRIILSPAKKMKVLPDYLEPKGKPIFEKETEDILGYLQGLSYEDAKELWECNDKIATENYEHLKNMKPTAGITPAILSYDGIAFTYMAPSVFQYGEFDYVQEHLRILSGFYGVVKPMDGVVPYRLEMQAKAKVCGTKDLYAFWGNKLYDEVKSEDNTIINLASKEYSKIIKKYLSPKDVFITCTFGELTVAKGKEKVIQKGVYAKMARGEMVKFMAENNITTPEKIKDFNRLGYKFCNRLSTDTEYIFLKN